MSDYERQILAIGTFCDEKSKAAANEAIEIVFPVESGSRVNEAVRHPINRTIDED